MISRMAPSGPRCEDEGWARIQMNTIQTSENPTPGRRRFFQTAINGLGALITGAIGIPALLYLVLPPGGKKRSQWADAGDASRFEPHKPQEVTYRRNRVDGWKVSSEKATAWVVKNANGELSAFSPWCTHLGCAYHWEDDKQEFVCPCHTSFFSIDGKVLSGPAPRPLDRYEVTVKGNRVWLGPLRPEDAGRA